MKNILQIPFALVAGMVCGAAVILAVCINIFIKLAAALIKYFFGASKPATTPAAVASHTCTAVPPAPTTDEPHASDYLLKVPALHWN